MDTAVFKMKILTICINILCLKCCVSISNPNNRLEMIVDVIKSYEKPTAVVARVCWESCKYEKNMQLYVTHARLGIYVLK